MELLGLKNIEGNEDEILDQVSSYIFDTNTMKRAGKNGKKKTFDLNYDYKHYFPDFLKYHINLNKSDIDWWEFDKILDAIILDENSNMHKIIQYRCYQKPIKNEKTRQNIIHQQMLKLQNKYSLPTNNDEYGAEKLFNYLEKKVGETKE